MAILGSADEWLKAGDEDADDVDEGGGLCDPCDDDATE